MFPSKPTDRHIALKTSEKKNMKNKYFFKKTRCHCNGKLILLCLSVFKSLLFCFMHIV